MIELIFVTSYILVAIVTSIYILYDYIKNGNYKSGAYFLVLLTCFTPVLQWVAILAIIENLE